MNPVIRIVGVISILLLAAAAATCYVFAAKVDVQSIDKVDEDVAKLQILERDLTVELVKVNSNPAADFDTLASFAPAMREQRSQLKSHVAGAQSLSQADRSALLAYLSMLEGKEERIERFKSGFAIVRNSERYLPLAVADASATSRNDGAQALADEIESKLADLRKFLAEPNEVDRQRILLGLKDLRDAGQSRSASVVGKIDTFVAHATVLLEQKGPLAEVLRDASSADLAAEGKRLSAYFAEMRRALSSTRDGYQLSAWLLGAASVLTLLTFAAAMMVLAARRGAATLTPRSTVAGDSAGGAEADQLPGDVNDGAASGRSRSSGRSTSGAHRLIDKQRLENVKARGLLDDIGTVSTALRSHSRLLRETSHEVTTGITQATTVVEHAIGSAQASDSADAHALGEQLSKVDILLGEVRAMDPGPKTAEVIQRASDRVQRSLDALKQTEAFSATRHEQWCSVNVCLEHAIDLLALDTSSDVELEVSELPPILGIEAELVAIFAGILENCIEALGDTPTVRIKTEAMENEISVTIVDNGAGMDAATRKAAFRLYFSTKGSDRGAGLGIVRNLVKRHNGKVMMNSAPGKGTAVRVTFPVDIGGAHDDETLTGMALSN